MIEHIAYPPRWVRAVNRYRRLVGTFKNWPEFLAFKWRWRKDCPRLRTRGGLVIEVPAGATFEFKDIFLHDAYGCPEVLRQLPEEPTVLDVGANVGFFSLYALDRRPGARCFSLEPLGANYRILERQHALNPGRRWQIFQEAAAGRDGLVEICSQKDGEVDGCATIRTAEEPSIGRVAEGRRRVPGRTLPTIFAAHSLDYCDWLKLDCEGSEYDIVYQCPEEALRKIKVISAELHPMDGQTRNPGAICAHLVQCGFRLLLADDAVVHALR